MIADDTLYRCLDKLLAHKQAFFSFFSFLRLTSTDFESDPPFEDKRRFGYSWDRRADCVQVVIALSVTPEGIPLAYEVKPGNTAEQVTLAAFLKKMEQQYGRSERTWFMDRGIPSKETLASMRESDLPLRYLMGTPKGRLTRLETAFLDLPWQEVRQSVGVKLLVEDGELYVLVRSQGRLLKERGMRRRRLTELWRRLVELQGQSNSRDRLMLKLGAAKKEAGRAWNLVDICLPETDEEIAANGFSVRLRRDRLRYARRREGRYLLRSNRVAEDPATLWHLYMQIIEIDQAFNELKHGLAIPADLPSARGTDRGAHLRVLQRLLPARHALMSFVKSPAAVFTYQPVRETPTFMARLVITNLKAGTGTTRSPENPKQQLFPTSRNLGGVSLFKCARSHSSFPTPRVGQFYEADRLLRSASTRLVLYQHDPAECFRAGRPLLGLHVRVVAHKKPGASLASRSPPHNKAPLCAHDENLILSEFQSPPIQEDPAAAGQRRRHRVVPHSDQDALRVIEALLLKPYPAVPPKSRGLLFQLGRAAAGLSRELDYWQRSVRRRNVFVAGDRQRVAAPRR